EIGPDLHPHKNDTSVSCLASLSSPINWSQLDLLSTFRLIESKNYANQPPNGTNQCGAPYSDFIKAQPARHHFQLLTASLTLLCSALSCSRIDCNIALVLSRSPFRGSLYRSREFSMAT